MRELRAALVGEGVSDAWFLPRVLTRALEDICWSGSVDVEVRDVSVLPIDRSGGLVEGVCTAVGERLDDLFFYHYDGGANRAKTTMQYWEPLVDAWRRQVSDSRELVPVVPVLETEAWALPDKAALRAVVGSGWPKRDVFQTDRLADVERLEDPKRTLREISERGRGGRRRARKPEQYLPRIADELSLDALRDVPSFRQWSTDTVEALRKMRFLP
jgi:hypothetical protein